MFRRFRKWASLMRKNGVTLWYACRDPRTPLWQKGIAVGLAVYAFSPIDLIPDFIPVVGLLDDAAIVPVGMMLLLRLLPEEVRLESQRRIAATQAKRKTGRRMGMILLLWLMIVIGLALWYAR
ncbi:YkvA family protein [Erwinia sp. CGal63]|uniref:YkvA family protein n=1 Tax=Erwinia sp. CGal63 TaxID=2919889 RepID=UPI00300B805D